MTIEAKVILDSISPEGVRLTTMELRYPRFIHAEVMTHRVFTRNASSSRAVPVEKLIEEAVVNPALPERWGVHNSGMQDGGEMTPFGAKTAKDDWLAARDEAVKRARIMLERPERASKQIINRILEPFTHISVVVSSTYWANFYALRDHPAADPTMFALAQALIKARSESTPLIREHSDWHLPYTDDQDISNCIDHALESMYFGTFTTEKALEEHIIGLMCKLSTARCARVSYLNHDKKRPTIDEDLALFDKLMSEAPFHASPAEHVAQPDRLKGIGLQRVWENEGQHGNFIGWKQFRKQFVGECVNEYAPLASPVRKVA